MHLDSHGKKLKIVSAIFIKQMISSNHLWIYFIGIYRYSLNVHPVSLKPKASPNHKSTVHSFNFYKKLH